MDVTRVNKQTFICPDGTAPCSEATKSDNTICYPPEELETLCPITFIDFVTEENLPNLEGDYQKLRFDAA